MTRQPIYCCVPIEFIQPWDQNEAIRKVRELGLGNMVMIEGTFHVGNSDEERRKWKERFPHLAAKIDATPRFPERPEHGMCAIFELPIEFRIEQLRLCRELGLLVFGWILSGQEVLADQRERLRAAGEGLVFCEPFMCENLSMLSAALSPERLKEIDATPLTSHAESYFAEARAGAGPSIFDDPEKLDFQAMHDWFVGRFRAHGHELRRRWQGPLASIEASPQIRLVMEAGTDVPIFEMVPSEPRRGLAATRGAAKAYGKSLWGVHAAMGYYRAPTDLWTPERLRIAYDSFYAGGASFFSEPNLALCNWGSCSGFFSIRGSPPIRWAEKECRPFDDPVCVRAREVLAEHYRFTQFHQRPERGPRVPMGYLLGHLDAWTGGQDQERLWLLDHPGFRAPEALATWHHFENAFETEPWYIAPRKYYWQADSAKALRYGTPPCGQVDLVPIEAPLEVLASYRCLVLLGWNTMAEGNYAKLKAFVEGGGTLLLSVPHLSTRTRADRLQEFIHSGHVDDLCGVRVVGPGEQIEEVLFAERSRSPRHVFAQGTLYLEGAPLARLELHGARTLAYPREKPDQPVLLEHQAGKGVVYLLATWEYPGARLDAFITDVLRTLAEGEQGEIALAGTHVEYAIYDGATPGGTPFAAVYVVNTNIYGQPQIPWLQVRGQRIPLRLEGYAMRPVWIFENLVVAPSDKFVRVDEAVRERDGWRVRLAAEPGEHSLQLAGLGCSVAGATLDGLLCELAADRDGALSLGATLTGTHELRIAFA